MELDDQLAALVAGELDADDARALRARAAADPALAQRLARHEQLEELLTTWEAPRLSEDAVARIDAAIDAALDDLGDDPLADRRDPTGPLTAAPATTSGPAATGGPGQVADLAAARQRRSERRALPAWVPAATVAAALVAVVGIGVVSGLGGAQDDAVDTVADAPASDTAEESADREMAEGADSGGEEQAALAPAQPDDVVLAEGELLALLDAVARSDGTGSVGADDATEADDGVAGDGDAGEDEATAVDACVVEALERDTVPADGREVAFLARGSYADQPAQFVVVRTPGDGSGDLVQVLAYDPVDCTLLGRDETVR